MKRRWIFVNSMLLTALCLLLCLASALKERQTPAEETEIHSTGESTSVMIQTTPPKLTGETASETTSTMPFITIEVEQPASSATTPDNQPEETNCMPPTGEKNELEAGSGL